MAKSPSERAREEIGAWLREVKRTCQCLPVEVRIEGGLLECAHCARPIIEHSPTATRSILPAVVAPIIHRDEKA